MREGRCDKASAIVGCSGKDFSVIDPDLPALQATLVTQLGSIPLTNQVVPGAGCGCSLGGGWTHFTGFAVRCFP